MAPNDSAKTLQRNGDTLWPLAMEAAALIEPLYQKKLLIPYLIIPVVLIFCLIDTFFFARSLTKNLPFSPEQVLVIALFFNIPHIVASSLLFLNGRYLSSYRRKILLGIALSVAICVTFPFTVGFYYLVLLYGFLTVNHVIGQQIGLCRVGLIKIGREFQGWRWSALILGNIVYAMIYFIPTATFENKTLLVGVASSLLCMTLYFAAKVYEYAVDVTSRMFLLANQAMLISIFILALSNYPFFVILIPRIVHDVCAFMVYYSHDKNRLKTNPRTPIQNVVGLVGIPAVWATPVVAVVLAFPLTVYIGTTYGEIIVIGITLFHYFSEAFAWKRGSEMRSFVQFK
jgi:hypothetical protein